MNILGLVFSLLLILSYGFFASWNKQVGNHRLRKTYTGHTSANRKILNCYQSELYGALRFKPTPPKMVDKIKLKKQKPKEIELNRFCSKINLWPLVNEGKEAHMPLYELTAKLIRTFYSKLGDQEKRFEYHLLDAMIASFKEDFSQMEKADLKDDHLQKLYYKMLKGTKRWNLAKAIGYPSILDYVKVEEGKDKLCVFHAHPDLITVLFNGKVAAKLYREVHKEKGPLLTKELIERICSEAHLTCIDQALFELLELGKPSHEENKKTFIAQDTVSDVTLKKTFYLKG